MLAPPLLSSHIETAADFNLCYQVASAIDAYLSLSNSYIWTNQPGQQKRRLQTLREVVQAINKKELTQLPRGIRPYLSLALAGYDPGASIGK